MLASSVPLLRTPFIDPINWSTNEDEILITTLRIRRNGKTVHLFTNKKLSRRSAILMRSINFKCHFIIIMPLNNYIAILCLCLFIINKRQRTI